MWFGQYMGTAYTGQWWGDGGVVPPPPTPASDFPLGLRNVAWRPLKRVEPVVVTPELESEPQTLSFVTPEPQIVTPAVPLVTSFASYEQVPTPVEPIDVPAVQAEVQRALLEARRQAIVPAPSSAPASDEDGEAAEAVAVLVHVI